MLTSCNEQQQRQPGSRSKRHAACGACPSKPGPRASALIAAALSGPTQSLVGPRQHSPEVNDSLGFLEAERPVRSPAQLVVQLCVGRELVAAARDRPPSHLVDESSRDPAPPALGRYIESLDDSDRRDFVAGA